MHIQNWFIMGVAILKLGASFYSLYQGDYKIGFVYFLVSIIDGIMSTVKA